MIVGLLRIPFLRAPAAERLARTEVLSMHHRSKSISPSAFSLSRSRSRILSNNQPNYFIQCSVSHNHRMGGSTLAQKWSPTSDLPIRAEARGITEEAPIADTDRRFDCPVAHWLRDVRRCLVLNHPEDHGRAVTRRGADRGPALSRVRSRHGRLDPTGYCDVCMPRINPVCGGAE